MADKSNRAKGSRKPASTRPDKPYPEFPLYPHPLGYWSKKIKGTIHHFGRWGRVKDGKLTPLPYEQGWNEALEAYKAQVDEIQAGKTPRTASGRLTVKELCDRFYTAKKRALDAGEITARTLAEYDATGERLVNTFGRARHVDDLAADDFEKLRADLAAQYGPVRLGNEVQRVRTVFKYGYEAGLIDRPVRFGPQFVKPSKHVLRKHRASGGVKLFTADEIRRMLKAASPQLRAMILLGINCGFGNADCGTLPRSAVDLKTGWLHYPRPKTGIDRRCPLWPETVKAIKAVLTERASRQSKMAKPRRRKSKFTHPDTGFAEQVNRVNERVDSVMRKLAGRHQANADDDHGLVFITKYGKPWSQGGSSDSITAETRKLLHDLEINGRRGLGFDTLRHTFRTQADSTKDFTAVRTIMGHADDSIDANYTHGVEDSRLQAVVDHVHGWLYPPKPKSKRRPR